MNEDRDDTNTEAGDYFVEGDGFSHAEVCERYLGAIHRSIHNSIQQRPAYAFGWDWKGVTPAPGGGLIYGIEGEEQIRKRENCKK